jgi:hypothetical protein
VGDWFRSERWDREEFERRLARARPHNRPQYLKIQALTFLDTGDPELRRVAIGLLLRVYRDQSGAAAFERPVIPKYLADAYDAEGEPERAVSLYFEAIELQKTSTQVGNPRLKLAALVLRRQLNDQYRRAFEILTDPEWDRRSFLDSAHFEYAKNVAFLAARLNDQPAAASFAAEALHLAATRTRPEFPRHPTVGLIRAVDSTLAALRQLIHN